MANLEWLESRANTPLQATLSDFAVAAVRGSAPGSSAAPRVARVRPAARWFGDRGGHRLSYLEGAS